MRFNKSTRQHKFHPTSAAERLIDFGIHRFKKKTIDIKGTIVIVSRENRGALKSFDVGNHLFCGEKARSDV